MIKDIEVDAKGNELHFRSNPQLRPAGTKIKLSAEQVEEYLKCAKDIVYFTENYIYIADPNKGRSLIKLYPFQKQMLENFQNNRYNINLCSRQVGKCVSFFTKIKTRNKNTGKVRSISIGRFYIEQYILKKVKNITLFLYNLYK